jgi:anti-sigma regulatory factor (Ser/Thr protein kinase)
MKNMEFHATLENLDSMMEFIMNDVEKLNLESKQKMRIRLACEEALVNIISYAYPKEIGKLQIIHQISVEPKKLWLQIIDEGIPFNPLLKEEPDLALPIEQRKMGGLGVYIFRNIMDTVHYERKEGKNILSFTKDFVD